MNNAVVVGMLSYLMPWAPIPPFLEKAHSEMGRGRLAFLLYRLTGLMKYYEDSFPFDIVEGGEWCQDVVQLLHSSADLRRLLQVTNGLLDYGQSITVSDKEAIARIIARDPLFPPRA